MLYWYTWRICWFNSFSYDLMGKFFFRMKIFRPSNEIIIGTYLSEYLVIFTPSTCQNWRLRFGQVVRFASPPNFSHPRKMIFSGQTVQNKIGNIKFKRLIDGMLTPVARQDRMISDPRPLMCFRSAARRSKHRVCAEKFTLHRQPRTLPAGLIGLATST